MILASLASPISWFVARESAKNRIVSLTVALMVGLASLRCGATLYPVVVYLSADNERKTHDVGKIGISDGILLKPGKLDDAEMVIMRTHVEQGERL